LQVDSASLFGDLAEAAQKITPWTEPGSGASNCNLIVITPQPDVILDPKYYAVAQAWASAREGLRKNGSVSINAWRALYEFGTPVNPDIFLFQDKNGGPNDYFCLNPTDTIKPPYQPSWWIAKAIEALGLHWHVSRGGAMLHASGVERNGGGYLFLGKSGSGKSTVAGLSKLAGAGVVHDDQVMLGFKRGRWLLAHPKNGIYSPLRAVFILKKSKNDDIVPLTPQATALGLGKSLLEFAIGQNLYGSWVRQAFHNVAVIARKIPGYELHFRKTPDFWNLIDAKLGS
jgi:hypothetical protein